MAMVVPVAVEDSTPIKFNCNYETYRHMDETQRQTVNLVLWNKDSKLRVRNKDYLVTLASFLGMDPTDLSDYVYAIKFMYKKKEEDASK